MTTLTLPTLSDVETVAYEMATRLSDNVLDLWTRLLTGLRRTENDKGLEGHLETMLNAFHAVRRLPTPESQAAQLLTQEESMRLAMQPCPLMLENLVRLRALLHECERAGHGHPNAMPLHWYLEAQRVRANQVLNDITQKRTRP